MYETESLYNYYHSLPMDELAAHVAEMERIEVKLLAERAAEPGPVANKNYDRLKACLSTARAALKQTNKCAAKKFSFDNKHHAAYKAAKMRRTTGHPGWSYYKCPTCKDYHISKGRDHE